MASRCDTPVLFLHGEDDCFVPCAMGRENCACCRAADKTLLTFPAAGHGMSYMADRERYLAAVTDFLERVLGEEYGTKRYLQGEADGLQKGKIQGKEEGVLTILKNLLKKGISDSYILEITGVKS